MARGVAVFAKEPWSQRLEPRVNDDLGELVNRQLIRCQHLCGNDDIRNIDGEIPIQIALPRHVHADAARIDGRELAGLKFQPPPRMRRSYCCRPPRGIGIVTP